MTKDLVLIRGESEGWLSTEEFIHAVKRRLENSLV